MILIYDIIKCITFRRVLVALRQVGLCHMICTIRGWPVRPNTCSEKLEQYTAGIVEKATTAVSDRSLRSGFGYSSFARRGTAVLDGIGTLERIFGRGSDRVWVASDAPRPSLHT